MKQTIYLWGMLVALFCLSSCADDDTVTTVLPEEQTLNYDGTVLQFISQPNGYGGMRFDSLVFVVSNVAGLSDSLARVNGGVTLFAVPNEGFVAAHQALKGYRKSMKLDEGINPASQTAQGAAVSLSDLMIAPFEVVDTVVSFNPIAFSRDTTYVHRHYDYKEKLRHLTGRYVFMRSLPSHDVISGSAYKSMFNHEMNLVLVNQDASGMADAGKQMFQLVEMRGSKQQGVWVKAEVVTRNVKCSNGYVHVLSGRHEFGFNEITSHFGNYGNEKKKR